MRRADALLRQRDGEDRVARPAIQLDTAAVILHDLSHDREAEARALRLAVRGERLERAGADSSGMPGPSSVQLSTSARSSLSRRTPSVMCPPAWPMACTALRTRLCSARRILCGSKNAMLRSSSCELERDAAAFELVTQVLDELLEVIGQVHLVDAAGWSRRARTRGFRRSSRSRSRPDAGSLRRTRRGARRPVRSSRKRA